jgi:hypothetical protein
MANLIEDGLKEALEAAGTTNPRVIASPPSQTTQGRDYLIEGDREGTAQRRWWLAGQSVDGIKWYKQLADGH